MDLVFLRGRGTPNGPNGGSLLTYWLSRFVLPSGLEDAINSYILPMAIRLATGRSWPWAPYTPGHCMWGWIIAPTIYFRSISTYDFVTHTDTCFLQIFLWKRFEGNCTQARRVSGGGDGGGYCPRGEKLEEEFFLYPKAKRWTEVKHIGNKSFARVIDEERSSTSVLPSGSCHNLEEFGTSEAPMAEARFIGEGNNQILANSNILFRQVARSVGARLPGGALYWRRCIQSMHDFINNRDRANLEVVSVPSYFPGI